MNRRYFLKTALAAGTAALIPAVPGTALAQATPNAAQIESKLQAAPRVRLPREQLVTVPKLKRDRRLRRLAPSIDIQSINFEFGSASIPYEQRWKIEQIAIAMKRMLHRDPNEIFLVEGHTDAVGSYTSNQALSERRARSVTRDLVRYFGVPRHALENVGYGEEELLVPTPYAEWRNRRVTLRRITDFVARY
jgi:outer membrane protein OmpA-like peptidoglycan-associated protein